MDQPYFTSYFGIAAYFGRNLKKGSAMKTHEDDIVELGDARVETRGFGIEGPLDVQTLQRTYNGGIQTDD